MITISRYLISICIYICVGIFLTADSSRAETKAWEGTITLPAYPWKDDINPKFFTLEDSIIYPYTMQDMLTNKKEDTEYKALFLENEYLKVTCLPELAGRIYSVLDKTTGEEMFHTNRVVKPGLISMRGAWISGGIEWNTGPHGHSVTIVSPVNAAIKNEPGGSVTLVISNTEKIFRTRWTVHLTLHPGKAYLDEHIEIFNPNYAVHPYYFWNCTAFYCLPGTKFIYPMTLGTGHDGTEFFSWPIHEGKDLRWLKNYDQPTSVFAYDCVFDFFGAYDVDLDRGIVQVADHRQLIGKKAWTWGQSDDGIVSQRNLHEGNEQYIEVQSGPLLTQADYGLLHPRQTVKWQEFWYPVHGLIDGYEYATRDIAIQRLAANDGLEFRMIATGFFPNAHIQIQQENKNVMDNQAALSPNEPYVLQTKLNPYSAVDVIIKDGQNNVLASYRSPLPIPEQTPPGKDWQSTKDEKDLSAEEMYLKGLTADQQTDRQSARDWYQKALAVDSGHTESLKGLAVLDLEAGLFDDAVQHLQKAVERNPDDGESWMYLSAIYIQQGDLEQALKFAAKSIRSSDTAHLGYDLVGTVMMKRGEFASALEAFQKSSQSNPDDARAKENVLIAKYANGLYDEAHALAAERINTGPTNPVPHAVLALLEKETWTDVQKDMLHRLGEIEFELIESSLVFANFGLYKEAYQMLKSTLIDANPIQIHNPMVYYYLADWAERMGEQHDALHWTQLAGSELIREEFPSRLEAVAVLKQAIIRSDKNGISSARSHLRLGNLYGGLGRMDEAKLYWINAVESDPSFNIGQRNLGLLAWKQEKNLAAAAEYYQAAIKAKPDDPTLYRDLSEILIQMDKRIEAIALLESILHNGIRMDSIETLGRAYLDEKQYTKAIDLLSGSTFSNWENRTVSRNVFVQAHIERGKELVEKGNAEAALEHFSTALTYPVFLGVGRPANPAEAEALYWKGAALKKLNRISEAKEAWQAGANSRPERYRVMCEKAQSKL